MIRRALVAATAAVLVFAGLVAAHAADTGGAGGPHTDRTNLSFTGSRYTSKYHLYAAGLDWTRPVGLLVYTDGSGEYGLKNPSSTYLLAGTNGMVNVAKRQNMVLLTPFAPNTACADGGGSCWYQGDPVGYAKWSEELALSVEGLYPIDRDRVAIGGYSSGAQWATEYFTPSGAAQRIATDGVVVGISYGGSPKTGPVAWDAGWKARVHMSWNVGDKDSSYTTTSSYGVKAGEKWYRTNGFATSLDVVPGLGHSRSGTFGPVMEAQIRAYVAASVAPEPTPTPTPPPPSCS